MTGIRLAVAMPWLLAGGLCHRVGCVLAGSSVQLVVVVR